MRSAQRRRSSTTDSLDPPDDLPYPWRERNRERGKSQGLWVLYCLAPEELVQSAESPGTPAAKDR